MPAAAAEQRPVRRAKIVATLGPASDGCERELVEAGLDVARLNFSHGTHADHARRFAAIRAAATAAGRSVAVMQDLQGPKIRVGRLAGGKPVHLLEGQTLLITTRDIVGDGMCVSCTYEGLPRDVRPGDHLLLDDGRIRLSVVATSEQEVRTRVEDGGLLGEHKGINLPGVTVSAPALTEKDLEDLRFGLAELGVDYVALSFIRSAAEVREAREVVRGLEPSAGRPTPLIVKLEKGEAIADLDAILEAADGVMVARGDLGVELAPEQVPMLQKQIIRSANQRGIPVITATQMLESMVTEEMPTRAESTDVANAVWDGTDALMLSAETAVGRHPLRVLRMMDRIIRAAETAELPGRVPLTRHQHVGEDPMARAMAITHAAEVLAEDLRAAAIIGVTGTGRTAELLSRGRPGVPVYAFSADERVCRRLALWWGVAPIHRPVGADLEMRVSELERHLVQCGALRAGETVVLTGVHPYEPGQPTNFVKYEVVGPPDASR